MQKKTENQKIIEPGKKPVPPPVPTSFYGPEKETRQMEKELEETIAK